MKSDKSEEKLFSIHASSIDWFFDCPARFAFNHPQLINLLEPTTPAAIAGTGLHAGAEHTLTPAKEKAGKIAPFSDGEEVAINHVQTSFREKEVVLPPEDQNRGVEVIRNEQESRTRRAFVKYYADAAPMLSQDVLHLERKFTMKIVSPKLVALPIRIHGRADLEGKWDTRDLKMRGKTPTSEAKLLAAGKSNEADLSAQLTTYWLYRRQETDNSPPLNVALDVLVPLKDSVNYRTVESTRTDADLSRYFAQLRAMTEMIKAGLYPPNPKSMFCSDNGCVWHLTGVCEMSSHYKRNRAKGE